MVLSCAKLNFNCKINFNIHKISLTNEGGRYNAQFTEIKAL